MAPMTPGNSISYYLETLLCDWGVRSVCACTVSIVSWFVGGIDQLITSLTLLMVADFVLGFWRAWKQERFSGDKLKHGGVKFIMYTVTVQCAVQFQNMIVAMDPSFLGAHVSFAVRDWVIAYLILNEFISCAEHLVWHGVPLPESWIKRLKHYRGCVFGPENERRKRSRKEKS